jgi:ABC-2 type transport system ATP-binding protein
MNPPVIELRHLTKLYGTSRGVKDLNLTIGAGQIFGFLGPNGAGKTTTISMLVDLIRPTSGSINLFGLDSVKESLAIRRRIGFLAGDFALDKDLTGWEELEYLGNLKGGYDKKFVQSLAKRLDCNLSRPIHTLSRGNKQKVGLISALMHQPELLIFDEPTSGLDPLIQAEFNKIILEHKEQGKTAFISSHLLSEVQEICNEVAFIREGKFIATKKLSELASAAPKRVRIITKSETLPGALKKLRGIKHVIHTGNVIECSYEDGTDALIQFLAAYKLDDLTIQEADLETVFMGYYGEKNA